MKSNYLIAIFACCLVFATPKETLSQSCRFAFLTDLHVAPNTPSELALESMIQEINQANFDFVVLTGDLTNTGSNAELSTVKRILNKLTIPIHVITGNHETNWSESAGSTFLNLWKTDRFIFEHNNYVFVGFGTGPYMRMGDGIVRSEDINWLKQELPKHANKTLLVASHYPLGDGLSNWHEITKLLKQYNAKLVMCGHGHKLALYNFDGIPGIMGQSMLTAGSTQVSYNMINLVGDSIEINRKIVGEHPSTQHFAAFNLQNNTISKTLQSSTPPDFSVNANSAAQVLFTRIDSASVFTGISTNNNLITYINSKSELLLINTKLNKVVWKKQLIGKSYATPLFYKDVILTACTEGNLSAFFVANGNEKWRINLGAPIISNGLIEKSFLYQGAGNTMAKVDLNNVHIVWQNQTMQGQLQGQPVSSKNSILFGAWDTHLYCLDKETGQVLWKWNNGHKGVLYSPANVVPAISKQQVIIVAPDRYMTAIDLSTGKTIWRSNSHKVRESMGVAANKKTVYAKLMNDSIIAMSTNTLEPEMKWSIDAGFGYEHNPCPILEHKGILYAGGKNGLIVAINTKNKKIIWKYKAGNTAVNQITADPNGGVWCSLIEGKIIKLK